jgi:hypothetical protein
MTSLITQAHTESVLGTPSTPDDVWRRLLWALSEHFLASEWSMYSWAEDYAVGETVEAKLPADIIYYLFDTCPTGIDADMVRMLWDEDAADVFVQLRIEPCGLTIQVA